MIFEIFDLFVFFMDGIDDLIFKCFYDIKVL